MQIDVFQDTVCPWCRIGKRHLALALAEWTGDPITVRYHPFFLNESLPPAGVAFRPYMLAKGGGRISLEQFFDAPRQAGAAIGLDFNFEAIEYAPNTLLSHRLIALSGGYSDGDTSQGLAILDAVYQAYFVEGRDIGQLDVLVDIATAHGWTASTIRDLLTSDTATAEIEQRVATARQIGVSGVPFFVFNNMFATSGAQPPHVLRQIIEQAQSMA